jgi:ethanolamine ammonia-lyase large subunit
LVILMFATSLAGTTHTFPDLGTLLARASPDRAGDRLAGLAAENQQARVAARIVLADVPLARFLAEPLIDPATDEVSRLILDQHDAGAFAPVASQTVGEFRDWLLSDEADTQALAALVPGLTPEMAAAVSKLMRNQDLIAAARKIEVVTRFRNTIGLKGRLSVRLQPNHPTDDLAGIGASILDGLMYG